MTTIFVNGISAKSGGGRSILSNFLSAARDADDDLEFVVAVEDPGVWRDLACPRVRLIKLGCWSATPLVPWASLFLLPRLAQRAGCDAVFNPGDVPIRTHLPQIFLFDWPYAAYPDSPAWGLSSRREWLVRKAKLWLFRKFLPQIDLMIAQSVPLAQRLQSIYDLRDVEIVPNAVSLENLNGGEHHDFGLGEGFKFLCLSRYYSHKNIEIFLPVARKIREQRINAKIITTLSDYDHNSVRKFLNSINDEDLSNIIINVGTVPMSQVPSLYKQTDALLLPTFLESFSGTYVEAMYHGLPILTSDLDFARGVCGEAAFYFDPSDATAILGKICQVMEHPNLRVEKVAQSKVILAGMPDWPTAYRLFTDAFRTVIRK